MSVTRPVMRYHGGKWRLAPWVISHFPQHRVYVEPFCGAASVLMRKDPSRVEVIADQYGRITNAFRLLRDDPERLCYSLAATPYSRAEYLACREISDDPLEDARRILVLGRQSHGSTGASGGKLSGWRRGVRDRGRSTSSEWSLVPEWVWSWADRLRAVFIENDDAAEVSRRWDSEHTLHYVDPPYVADTRRGTRGYAHEMTDCDHRQLALSLRALRGAVVVSGYASDLYAELFAGWTRVARPHLADKGIRTEECLWIKQATEADHE